MKVLYEKPITGLTKNELAEQRKARREGRLIPAFIGPEEDAALRRNVAGEEKPLVAPPMSFAEEMREHETPPPVERQHTVVGQSNPDAPLTAPGTD